MSDVRASPSYVREIQIRMMSAERVSIRIGDKEFPVKVLGVTRNTGPEYDKLDVTLVIPPPDTIDLGRG